ncbi:putative methylmalonyl-CoA mutase small subunit MutA [Hoyosella rhizosphaerae]|uniref:methylmalonyl-CoA mutase n=1 Tax=Hoyosella rhizosphaerae TaxID=1755582 RepID=A0A916U3V3_9ACTN|nr:putative methylmalonyl-CoA mutase small subunit MutA [Hoyosella rhizosphaerae]
MLAKSQGKAPEEFGELPDDFLVANTLDGLSVRPLYTSEDEVPEQPLPGQFPFTRGTNALRDVHQGWYVTCRFGDGATTAADLNDEILGALQNGAGALWVTVRDDNIAVEELGRVLSGVYLDLAPVILDAGTRTAAAANAVLALLDERGRENEFDRTSVRISLGATPLTSAFAATEGSTAATVDLPEALALAKTAGSRDEQIRAITVDGTVFHDAGAHDVQELGAACAAAVEYVSAMMSDGLTAAQALAQIEFRFGATDDQFHTIAKFRAARQVWARVAEALGAPECGDAPQHAVTSSAMMTQRDPWVNMLRTTVAAFGAGVGGADFVTVLPFDSALPASALDVSASFAQRIARNTQLLLLEEANVGRVVDPAAGSWFVERLTADIANAAWEVFQEIESGGGYLSVVKSGELHTTIARTREERDSQVASRTMKITGINEFPNLAEKPIASDSSDAPHRLPGGRVHRYAEPFESLRDRSDHHLARTGERPQVLLAPLGPLAEHNVRTTFVTNLLAAGGIEAINPGVTNIESIAEQADETNAALIVICGSDKRYADEASAAIEALKADGRTVLLAGSASALSGGALSGGTEPDGFVSGRMDAVQALSDMLEKLGVK